MQLVKPESTGHWYDKNGNSAHDADLRRARKEGLFPSVTTVLQIKAKPGLDAWKQQNTIMSALTLPRLDGESLEDFAERVVRDSKETASNAAQIGTDVHAWAEAYCKCEPIPPPTSYWQVCYLAQEWIDENIDLDGAMSEQRFVNQEYGYAGTIDLIAKWKKTGQKIILDFKTQGIKTGKKAVFYDEWSYQLSAYAAGQDCMIGNLVLSTDRLAPQIAFYEWTKDEYEKAFDIFKLILQVWQREKNYDPRKVAI